MRIEILSDAEDDLVTGAKFYERRRAGLGEYFLNSLYSDIDSLLLYAGIHRVIFGFIELFRRDFPSRKGSGRGSRLYKRQNKINIWGSAYRGLC
jgi:hypothetical protein